MESGRRLTGPASRTRRRRAIVPEELAGQRLDRVLASLLADVSRAAIQRLIAAGKVTVDDDPAGKASARVAAGQRVVVEVPTRPQPELPQARDVALDIVHEDDEIVVINKPAGLVVHAGAGSHSVTLVDGLLHRFGDSLSGRGGDERPGIVHRLDKGTSGLMVAARTDAAHDALAHQFAARTVEKEYAAIVFGCPRQSAGVVDLALGRDRGDRTKVSSRTDRPRAASTRWELEEDLGGFALLRVLPRSGRMHQIRAHLAAIQHPCVGDAKYAGARWKGITEPHRVAAVRTLRRPALHARRLCLDHPRDSRRMEFVAPLPQDLRDLLEALRAPS